MKIYADGKALTKEPVSLVSVTDGAGESKVRIDTNLKEN